MSAPVTVLLTVLLSVLVVLLGAAPAAAHARFTGSDPAEGAQVQSLPDTVVMSYSEEVAPQFVETAVITPDGTTVPTTADADGVDVTVDLGSADVQAAAGQGGTWQVVARVVSVDGHPVEHTTSFEVAEPATPSAEEPAAASGTARTAGSTDTAGATSEATAEPVASPAADPTVPAVDPAGALTDELPRWAVAAGAAAVVLAAAAALLVQLRRRPPTG